MPPWIYTVLGRRWFRGAKRNGGSDFSKPPYRQWYRKAHEILCPSAVFFFSPLWGQMFLNWFTTSINYKCYTNVRGVFDFDKKTGWIVTKLGHFKDFFEKWRKKRGSTRRPADSIRLYCHFDLFNKRFHFNETLVTLMHSIALIRSTTDCFTKMCLWYTVTTIWTTKTSTKYRSRNGHGKQ